MSKRARTEDADAPRVIPKWLLGSGVEPASLRQFMAWMEEKNLAFISCGELHDTSHDARRFNHPVKPHSYVDMIGGCVLFCEKCAPRCQCCDDIEVDMKDPNQLDNPHDLVCQFCASHTCDHGVDDDAWPAYCEGCERGCREPETCTLGGQERDVCERCLPDA